MAYSNSKLVSYTKISPNKTVNRTHLIDTITIHCVVGQCSVETLGNVFADKSRKASSNYGIGPDGRIGMYVEEKDRSWCSSNAANDHRAITIEVASETKDPYKVTDKAYAALLDLVTDICKRNNIKKLLWKGDKSLIGQVDKQNMTVHRWFANKSCPGDYLYGKHPEIAAEVNKRLGVTEKASSKEFKVRVNDASLNVRKGPGVLYSVVSKITDKGVYTIVEEKNGWGKLKSGAGWISLKYCTKIK
ncbi:MAG: N-acetylmuramoyl-L-alanine amidase [Bacteroidales bacterium]|nr:N-acetylmuramoyl-L-alanine amidase [Bacteroidales bacterium]